MCILGGEVFTQDFVQVLLWVHVSMLICMHFFYHKDL